MVNSIADFKQNAKKPNIMLPACGKNPFSFLPLYIICSEVIIFPLFFLIAPALYNKPLSSNEIATMALHNTSMSFLNVSTGTKVFGISFV